MLLSSLDNEPNSHWILSLLVREKHFPGTNASYILSQHSVVVTELHVEKTYISLCPVCLFGAVTVPGFVFLCEHCSVHITPP